MMVVVVVVVVVVVMEAVLMATMMVVMMMIDANLTTSWVYSFMWDWWIYLHYHTTFLDLCVCTIL